MKSASAMIRRDISFSNPQENILFDEVLLYLAERGSCGQVLRFWESEVTFIVLGRTSKVEEDITLAAIKEDIPVLRRFSGGGSVLQGKGCLNYTLILSKELNPEVAGLRSSYQFILSRVSHAFKDINIGILFASISDLIIPEGGRKISGNAQHRGKKFILHHGTILYNFDIALIGRYLKIPKEAPSYRQGRSHKDFLTNVNVASGKIKESLSGAWGVEDQNDRLLPEEGNCLKNFLETKSTLVETKNLF